MTAVLKRELKSYFSGMFGWVLAAISVLVIGAVSVVNNLISGSVDIAYVVVSLQEYLLLLIPIITAFTVTAENTTDNTAWLGSLPIRHRSLILGKYFAMLILFSACSAVLALLPPVLANFGTLSYGSAYTALCGYFLLGAAWLSICSLIASCFRNRILSVVVNVLLGIVIYLAPFLSAVLNYFPIIGMILCAGIAIGVGLFELFARKQKRTALICLILTLLSAGLYIVPDFYNQILPNVINALSIFYQLDGFLSGHFDLPAAVLLLSVALLFLVLAIQRRVQPRKKGGRHA